MKNTSVSTILCILAFFSFAQTKDELYDDLPERMNLTAAYDYHLNSNAIVSGFANQYFYGNTIKQSLKDKVFDKLQSSNHAGNLSNTSVFLEDHAKTFCGLTDVKYTLAFRHRQFSTTRFSKDAFGLFFYGNARYAGQTADLSGNRFRLYRYQQLYFSLEKTFERPKNTYKAGAGIALLKGQQYMDLVIKKGKLFTHQEGEYIDLDLAYELKLSDTANTRFWGFNGWGTSIDLHFSLTNKHQNTLAVRIKDIGFIHWLKDAASYSKDTFYHYDGIEASNIFSPGSMPFSGNYEDTLTNSLFSGKKEKRFSTHLPLEFSISYLHRWNRIKTKLLTGVQYYAGVDYFPRIYLRAIYAISPTFIVAPVIAYGGYGNLDVGVACSARFSSLILTLSSDHLDGFLFPSSATGQGIYISLSSFF